MGTFKRPRGRPLRTPAVEFLHRRDSLYEFLQSAWGAIGWELSAAKTMRDVQLAFAPLKHPSLNLDPLVFSETLQSTQSDVERQLRRTRALSERVRNLTGEHSSARELSQRASLATQDRKRGKIHRELLRRQSLERTISRKLASARRQLSKEESLLRKREAFFAQDEVLRFVKEKRYRVNPLNVAGALAGLPRTAYRQSLRKSTAKRPQFGNNLRYEIFLCIRRICRALEEVNRRLYVSKFKRRLRSIRKPETAARQLKEDWYYMRLAIEATLDSSDRTARIPFLITRLYFERSQSRSAQDQVLAELEKLI